MFTGVRAASFVSCCPDRPHRRGGRQSRNQERRAQSIRKSEAARLFRVVWPRRIDSGDLAAGHGSCRDFAVLMIEAARSFGFAARFASGYLAVPLDDPQEATSGSARGSNSRLGANLLARRWLDRFRSDQRQRRQHRPGHRCDRARSSPRDLASRHLFWISVGPPRHGDASARHVRYSGGDLGRPHAGRRIRESLAKHYDEETGSARLQGLGGEAGQAAAARARARPW